MPRLSIILPVLNEEAHIVACLHVLQPLRGPESELIVVDGGSRDRTLALAEPLADRVIAGSRGRAEQMNAGARQASGAILWFPTPRCRWHSAPTRRCPTRVTGRSS